MKPPSLRILTFGNCPLDPTLGSGKTRLARANGLRERGHQVEAWDAPRLLRPAARKLGVRLGLALSARQTIARVDLARFDVVEFFGAEMWWATRWLQRQRRRPLIVAHTDGLELLANERLGSAQLNAPGRLERWLPFFDLERCSAQAFIRADRFAALCRLDVDYVVGRKLFRPEHAALIPPGLDPGYLERPFRAARENIVVFFGSWTPRKGRDHVAAVMNRFLAAHPAWRFLVIGAASAEAEIRGAFADAVSDRVDVAPKLPVDEIARKLERAKILFFPSEYEGFGLATAEAMACGCAAIVTPTGFGGDLASESDAVVCSFGDRDAMGRALEELAADDQKRERIARAGWARVQALAWPRAVDALEKTYLRWVAEWPRERSQAG